MAPPKPAYDVDWILSNNPNVHVTNHRDWFTSYMPFTTFVNPCLSDAADASKGMKVLGIGDVALPTNIHSTQTGPANQRTILLRNVLHAPAFFCNIPMVSQEARSTPKPRGCVSLSSNQSTGCSVFEYVGQSANQTVLDPGSIYVVHARWPTIERAKWESHQQDNMKNIAASNLNSAPLTQSEKTWLKDHYGGEFHFLLTQGLKIHNEEDRDEGRHILRALMEADSVRHHRQ